MSFSEVLLLPLACQHSQILVKTLSKKKEASTQTKNNNNNNKKFTQLFPTMKFKRYRKLLVCATPHTAVQQMTQLSDKAFEQPSKIQSSHAVLSLPYSRCSLSPFTLTQAYMLLVFLSLRQKYFVCILPAKCKLTLALLPGLPLLLSNSLEYSLILW